MVCPGGMLVVGLSMSELAISLVGSILTTSFENASNSYTVKSFLVKSDRMGTRNLVSF